MLSSWEMSQLIAADALATSFEWSKRVARFWAVVQHVAWEQRYSRKSF